VKLESIGEVIAERNFVLQRDGDVHEAIVVLLGKPQSIPNPRDFYSPYQIKRLNSDKIMGICGLDALEALQTIGVELEVIKRDSGGQLIWDGDDKGDLGVPSPDWKGK